MEPQIKPRLDYADLAGLPADGKRYEIIDGRLFVTASPTPAHQWASKRLQRQLEDYFEARGLGLVFNAPVDVILTQHDVVVPDILVVADRRQISQRGIEGPPVLVVELLSPSTAATDRRIKAQRYAELGVAHYWIVDPARRRVEAYRLAGGAYEHVTSAEGAATMTVTEWPELSIELGTLWL